MSKPPCAHAFYPKTDPTGQIMPGGFGHRERIVGVVADVAEGKLQDRPTLARYYLADQIDFVPDGQTIVVRMSRSDDAERISPRRDGSALAQHHDHQRYMVGVCSRTAGERRHADSTAGHPRGRDVADVGAYK